jgi:hypothetical protein
LARQTERANGGPEAKGVHQAIRDEPTRRADRGDEDEEQERNRGHGDEA